MSDRDGEQGLQRVYAYHCTRCNYLWFPKDYDYDRTYQEEIFEREPPKACARCKSKQWMSPRRRKTKHEGEWQLSTSSIARRNALKRSGAWQEQQDQIQDQEDIAKQEEREQLIKELSQYGEVTDCIVCHKPCLKSYYASLSDPLNFNAPRKYRMGGRHGGSGLKCYYPDGKQNGDVKLEDWPICCNPCNKKHFEQDYEDGNHGNPVTDVGKRITEQYCIFPYPSDKAKTAQKTKIRLGAKRGTK